LKCKTVTTLLWAIVCDFLMGTGPVFSIIIILLDINIH